MEEVYARVYMEELDELLKSANTKKKDEGTEEKPEGEGEIPEKSKGVCLKEFLSQFLLKRFNNKSDLIALMIASIIFSCDCQRDRYADCEIFLRFLTDDYNHQELQYFIFVRAVVEKETQKKFFDAKTGSTMDTRGSMMNDHQLNAVLDLVFGQGKNQRIIQFLQRQISFDETYRDKKKCNIYKFLYVALYDFFSYNLDGNYKNFDGVVQLNIGKKIAVNNPILYDFGGKANFKSRYTSAKKSFNEKVHRIPLSGQNPKKDFYEDFEDQNEIQDYRGLYLHSSSKKKRFDEICLMKDSQYKHKQHQGKPNEPAQKIDFGNEQILDHNHHQHLDNKRKEEGAADVKFFGEEFEIIQDTIFDDDCISPIKCPGDQPEYKNFNKLLDTKLSYYLEDLINNLITDELPQGNFFLYKILEDKEIPLPPGVDLKKFLYNIVYPKVETIANTIYQKDQEKFNLALGSEFDFEENKFEDLKIEQEMIHEEYNQSRIESDNDTPWKNFSHHIFQIGVVATELARISAIISASVKFYTPL